MNATAPFASVQVKELAAERKMLNVSLSDFTDGVYVFNVVEGNGHVSNLRVIVTQ